MVSSLPHLESVLAIKHNQHLVDSIIFLCNKAIELDPASADAYSLRGKFYDDFLFEISKAEEDLKMAIKLNPNHAPET